MLLLIISMHGLVQKRISTFEEHWTHREECKTVIMQGKEFIAKGNDRYQLCTNLKH